MEIELLYFEGCPHVEATRERLQEVLRDEGILEAIREIDVEGEDQAAQHRFVGSPSIRIDGIDVDPEVRGHGGGVLGCRVYGSSGVPPTEMVRAAVRAAKEGDDAKR